MISAFPRFTKTFMETMSRIEILFLLMPVCAINYKNYVSESINVSSGMETSVNKLAQIISGFVGM